MKSPKITKILKESGVRGLIWRAFSYAYKNYVRPALPSIEPVVYAGIKIPLSRKMGDRIIIPKLYRPESFEDVPGYEQGLVLAMKDNAQPGDRVVVVGGGLGVTAAIAAIAVGENGCVECFEGDMSGVKAVTRTAALNGLDGRLRVHHAVVGENVWVYGSSVLGTTVTPSELPQCDVLELDCEGAEIAILREMVILPRVVVVETHGFLGAPTTKVQTILESRGYQVTDCGWAEPRWSDVCVQGDIRVLVGKRELHTLNSSPVS
jgi:hypothetical protein